MVSIITFVSPTSYDKYYKNTVSEQALFYNELLDLKYSFLIAPADWPFHKNNIESGTEISPEDKGSQLTAAV